FAIAGTLSGNGSVDLGDGDDVLTLQDGSVLGATTLSGGAGANDRVVLDVDDTLALNGANVGGFEQLEKQGAGSATLAGAHSYTGTVLQGGTLEVQGTLETASLAMAAGTTLAVEGAVQAAGGTQTVLTGTGGAETVTVAAAA